MLRVLLWLVCGAGLLADAQDVRAQDRPFAAGVGRVLSAKCVSCHRPDNLKGGLDLTTRSGLERGGEGGGVVVAGKSAESPLFLRSVPEGTGRPEMPAKGEPLTKSEAELLREWIDSGAEWPADVVLKEPAKADGRFWSFLPLAATSPPEVGGEAGAWQRNPIDRFLWRQLREKGLSPNPAADPRTFIRRASYDLIGLPPTPEEVAAFVAECGEAGLPDAAVERLIDRLLASPHYGEQWGRHWLDVIRFGESRGYERNEIITNLWPFRDYIISSLNADKPFDRLIRDHLAGDVLGPNEPSIEVGSAFLVAGPYDDVGNQDPVAAAQIRADQLDEMIRATGEAFLGLTTGCARCHDHKFDPITTEDYYAWFATFAGTEHGPREVAATSTREARDARLRPLLEERAKLIAERDGLEADIRARAAAREAEAASNWKRPRASRYLTEERFVPIVAQQVRLRVTGTDANDPNVRQFRIDEFEVWTSGASSRNVALASNGGKAEGAAHDARDFAGAYAAALTIDGQYGQRWHAGGNQLVITFAAPESIERVVFSADRGRELPEDSPLSVFVGDYVIEVSTDGKEWSPVASSSDRLPATEVRKHARMRALVASPDDEARLAMLSQRIGELDGQLAAVPPLPVWWVGRHRPAPGPFAVYVGGNVTRRGAEVSPASPQVFRELSSTYRLAADSEEGARRLALANWLTAADQPLVPRVLANRLWHYHFGRGIVDTPSDFGYLGSRPTHPELLDWLAGELRRQGWQLKCMHRLIMTSQAYRQSGAHRPDAAAVDAESRLLWRFPGRRLAAEEIRDTLLSVAGKLDLTAGGPGFRLYEYQQDNVATYVPLDAPGPETYRRAVYHHNARAMRVDVLSDFDCPDPAFAESRRASTTTPLQALTMLNHQFSLDMGAAFAARLQQRAGQPSEQVQQAWLLAFGRSPTNAEAAAGINLIKRHGLPAFCRAVLNANELIYLE